MRGCGSRAYGSRRWFLVSIPFARSRTCSPFSRRSRDEGYDVALPAVKGRGTHLDFRLWRPGEPTALGPMGIPEPLEAAPGVDPDLLFTPLACFDRRGQRVGYGADTTIEASRA